MHKYIVKKMESEDEINGKAYVHYKAWHETYAGLIDAGYLEKHTFEKCIAITRKGLDDVIIAKDGERVVGFVGYGPYRGDQFPEYGEIFGIYVLSEYHSKKIGYALMNAAMQKLSDYQKIAVWVLKGNDRAIHFYEKYGFHFDGTEMEVMLGAPNTELRMIYERA